MKETLAAMKKKRAEGDNGFTLIELLVVVVIIGVLVAIAIPLYSNYRKGAANKSAASDVRGAISAVEQFYTENGNKYPDNAVTSAAGKALELKLGAGTATNVSVSDGNTVQYQKSTTGNTYVVCAMNADGEAVYKYDSAKGGSVTTDSAKTLAACVGTPTP